MFVCDRFSFKHRQLFGLVTVLVSVDDGVTWSDQSQLPCSRIYSHAFAVHSVEGGFSFFAATSDRSLHLEKFGLLEDFYTSDTAILSKRLFLTTTCYSERPSHSNG